MCFTANFGFRIFKFLKNLNGIFRVRLKVECEGRIFVTSFLKRNKWEGLNRYGEEINYNFWRWFAFLLLWLLGGSGSWLFLSLCWRSGSGC